jgi:hypothetical protein
LACDKANKNNDNFFVKILSWWDKKMAKVKKIVLDADGAEGTSKDSAISIDSSLNKVDQENGTRTKLAGGATDAGGGVVLLPQERVEVWLGH